MSIESVTEGLPPDPVMQLLRSVADLASQVGVLSARIATLEYVNMQMASDLILFAGTENALLKYSLFRAEMNTGKMRKDLEEVFMRWKKVVDTAKKEEASMPTQTVQ